MLVQLAQSARELQAEQVTGQGEQARFYGKKLALQTRHSTPLGELAFSPQVVQLSTKKAQSRQECEAGSKKSWVAVSQRQRPAVRLKVGRQAVELVSESQWVELAGQGRQLELTR